MHRLLFVYSSRIAKDTNGIIYSDGSFTADIWNRYLQWTDGLTVLMREDKKTYQPLEAQKRFNRIDSPKLKYFPLPDIMQSARCLLSVSLHRRLRKLIREKVQEAEFVIARMTDINGVLAAFYAKKLKKPYLTEVVSCPWDVFWNHGFRGKLIAPLLFFLTRKAVRDAPYAIYVTQAFLQKRYPTKGISAGISNVSLETCDETILNRRLEKIRASKEKVVIGTAAALNVPYKGHQYVLEALAQLKKSDRCNYVYSLIGTGEAREIEEKAKQLGVDGQLEILGAISHDQVFDWLDQLDIYIQPSLSEGLPRALIEAMSRGTPCIATNAGGMPELLESDYLCDIRGDLAAQISDKLLRLDLEVRERQAKRNFREASKYNRDEIEKRRKEFLGQCFAENGLINTGLDRKE